MQVKPTLRKPTARSVFLLCFETRVQTFYRRALRLHPDKGGDPELFKEVTHA